MHLNLVIPPFVKLLYLTFFYHCVCTQGNVKPECLDPWFPDEALETITAGMSVSVLKAHPFKETNKLIL